MAGYWTRLGKQLDRVERKATARYGDCVMVGTSDVRRFWDLAIFTDSLAVREECRRRGMRLLVRGGNLTVDYVPSEAE